MADFFLFFSSQYFVISFLSVGLFIDYKKFSSILLLVFFSTIINIFLKSLFQMPLPPPLKGFAFPSGHMQAAVVFFGMLSVYYRYAIPIAIFLVTGIGISLVTKGYHYWFDIGGALFVGASVILFYQLFVKKYRDRFIILSILGSIFFIISYKYPKHGFLALTFLWVMTIYDRWIKDLIRR